MRMYLSIESKVSTESHLPKFGLTTINKIRKIAK